MDGEIGTDEYAAKRAELHERQSAIRLQFETTDRDDREIADLAIRVFELSQTLESRRKTADYAAKREILELMCESACLNSQNLEIRLKKSVDLIAKQFPVSLNGAEESRTPDLVIANDALYQLSYRPD
jgi:site-specific DNA recombinase